MKTEIRLTFQDVLDARRLSLRPPRWLRVVLFVLAAVVGLFLVYETYDTVVAGGRDRRWLWPVGFATYFAAIYYLLIPWLTRRIYRQTKALRDPFTVELTEQEMKLASPRGSLCMKYSDFHKWKMNEKVVLLYQSDAMCHVLPSRVFPSPEDRAALIGILEHHLGKQKT